MPTTYVIAQAVLPRPILAHARTGTVVSGVRASFESREHVAREPRFDLHLPLRFFSSEGMVTGHCVNVSKSGMLAMFDLPVDIWLEGEISFIAEESHFSIKARVARIDGCDVGLCFRNTNDQDEGTIQRLLAMASAGGQVTV